MVDQAFVTGLKTSLESDPNLKRRGKRILDIVNSPPSKRRDRVLERLQAHSKASLPDAQLKKASSTGDMHGVIDWSKLTQIDWGKIIEVILPILLKLLPILIA